MPVPRTEQEQQQTVLKNKEKLTLVDKTYPFKSLLPIDLRKFTRSEVREYFLNTYDLDELIFSAIVDEKYFYKCPDRLRLPLIFYLAHTSSVYVNKMMLAGLIDKRVNRDFETMFETGVDEMSWDDTENYRMGGSYKWPSVSEVLDYRKKVKEVILDVIDNAPLELPVTQDHPWWGLFMGIEHERIHIETSSVLIRQLPEHSLKRPITWKYAPTSAGSPPGPNKFVKIPAGLARFGKPNDFPSYGWDNEYGLAEMEVPEFEASKYLVSNKEFYDFVTDNGYTRQELWTEEGWQWVEFRQAKHPVFWVCEDGCKSGCGAELAAYSHCNCSRNGTNGRAEEDTTTNGHSSTQENKYKYRAIYDVIDMPWDWPVDVNYHEAKAFCNWKGPGYRLPTEAEHNRLRGDLAIVNETSCDPCYRADYPANFNLKYGSSSPVNMFPPTSMGVYDVYGNVWEWTEDHFNGLPGFSTTFLYDDFSTPCFDGRHTLIMGGSWISTGVESSRFARYAFRRHFIQHEGFRVVRSAHTTPIRLCEAEVFVLGAGVTDNPITTPAVDLSKSMAKTTNVQFQYETEKELEIQLRREYGNELSHGQPLVKFTMEMVGKYKANRDRVINFGSGAGLTSFLLSKTFETVVGVEYCGRFTDAAMKIQEGKSVTFTGSGGAKFEAKLPEGAEPAKVVFKQMTWVPNEIEGFDVVLFEFLDRLNEPKGWLYKLWESVSPNSLVLFAASNKWDEKRIKGYIGKWFTFLEKSTIDGEVVTVWKLKP